MKLPIYLDYNATTPIDPRVKAKMCACLDSQGNFGNPASEHLYGQNARAAVEEARGEVAASINAESREIIWTSGATEAINLAIKGAAFFYQRKGKHIVTLASEHRAVLDCCAHMQSKGFAVTYLDSEKNGIVDLGKLEKALRQDTILVSILHANNEIGVIQDIAAIGALIRARGIVFHVDAAQSVGKIPIDVKKTDADLISMTAHKIYGPKGIGALYVRSTSRIHLEAQMHGGGQEHGLRSGTLATHQIVGMGEALRLAKSEMAEENKRILSLRNKLWYAIKGLPEVYLNGDLDNRISGNLNVSFGNIDGEKLFTMLNKDLAVSASAACTVASIKPSHVLKAIGVSGALAQSTVRFSLGRFTTTEEIDCAIDIVTKTIKSLRENHIK